jgi:rare lipoprotein A
MRAGLVTGALILAPCATAQAQDPSGGTTPPDATPASGDAPQTSGGAPATPRPRLAITQRRLKLRVGQQARVRGRVLHASGRRRVTLQVREGGAWRSLDHARTTRSGRFVLRDRLGRALSASVRVRTSGARTRRLGRLDVFRTSYASWYGPGLYGNSLGCGGTLGVGSVGVAHKSLPCGALVTFRHGGRTLRVPVIDRGPYVGGREFDLTAAAAQRLGFHGHGPVLAAH